MPVAPPKVVIDIGCGKSSSLETIRGVTKAERCNGVDWSDVSLDANSKHYAEWGEWIHCDIERDQVPLPDETADFVYSSHLIEHIENPYILLDEQLRLCKQGGIIAVVAPLNMYDREHRHVFTSGDDAIGNSGWYNQTMKYGIAGYGRLGKATERMLPVELEAFWDPPQMRLDSLSDCDVIFVCTPTPCGFDGHILEGIDEIASQAKDGCWVSVRSTVSPGATDILAARYPQLNWCVAPEIRTDLQLAEMAACRCPIFGYEDVPSDELRSIFYAARFMSRSEAELVKIVVNCALATQVALANEFHELAETLGASWGPIRVALLDDNRVGSQWKVTEERGFGGQCLPKDLDAAIQCLQQMGVEPYILSAVQKANKTRFRPKVMVNV